MTYDATITLKGQDQASPTIDQATKNILNNYKVMRQEVKATTAEFSLQNQTLVAAQGVFRSVGSVAGSLMNIYTQFQTQQIRVTDANNQLILAQLNYNQVMAQSGPATNEGIAASIQLAEAKQNVAQATQQETIGWIGMAFELGSTVSLMISSIPKIQQFAKELAGANAAANAAGGVGAAGPLGGLMAGGAGKGKMGLLGKGIAGVAGAGLLAGGLLTGGEDQDFGTKLASVGQSAAGGALLGATLGSVVPGLGTAIGAGAGAAIGGGVGIAQNFGKEIEDYFTNLFNRGGQPAQPPQQLHVVTVKIENATDNKISAIENSMGIQQVLQSHQ